MPKRRHRNPRPVHRRPAAATEASNSNVFDRLLRAKSCVKDLTDFLAGLTLLLVTLAKFLSALVVALLALRPLLGS